MHVRNAIAVIVVRWLNQFGYSINNSTTFNQDNTNLTNAPARILCGLEVYGSETTHKAILNLEVFFCFMSMVSKGCLRQLIPPLDQALSAVLFFSQNYKRS